MTRYALVEDKSRIVTNIVCWEGGEWLPPRNHHVVFSEYAGIGDMWDEENNIFLRQDEKGEFTLKSHDVTRSAII